jgi:hypothetical protein
MLVASSYRTHTLHSIRVIKRRALAGGRMDRASDFDPGGAGRTSRGAAGQNQM